MNIRNYFKFSGIKLRLRHFMLLTAGILLVVFSFFAYGQKQRKEQLFATAVMGAGEDIFIAVPYWVANSINTGDHEVSPFGTVNAEVIDKESYEGGSHGKHVILQLKLTVLEDSGGKYYYKNQPLEIDKWLNLRLGSIDEKVYITYLGKTKPDNSRKIFRVTVKKNSEEPFITDNLTIGDEMLNNKGDVMAKIVNKVTYPAEVRSFTDSGILQISTDSTRRDILLTVDVSAKRSENIYYFGELKKLRVGEKLNLFFNKATLWDGIITSVEETEKQKTLQG